jgi:uncharacterized protein YbbC (DUF1343 family)
MKTVGAGLVVILLGTSVGAEVVPGLDVLREMKGAPLRGKRLGLITNHTGKTRDGAPAAEVLRKELGLDVRALFSPEHGLKGEAAAGARIASENDGPAGLPVLSLYGETRKPTAKMLRGIDVLVFDIQDIGVRFYTYISTLKLAMDAAAEAGVSIVVLDRPNPRGGVLLEGPVLDPRFSSFVGIAPIPLVHGMTVGELAQFFNGEGFLDGERRVDLRVIPVRGWRREMQWEATGLAWTPTSPNVRNLAAAVNYPAMGLLEGVNLSEGRGTRETFLVAGAPWIDGQAWVERLAGLGLPGARFAIEAFVPRKLPEAPRPLYPGETCRGLRLTVEEPASFQAVRTGLSLLATARRLYPQKFRWKANRDGFFVDLLLGSTRPREGIEAGESVDAIVASFEPELEQFRKRRLPYLIYE